MPAIDIVNATVAARVVLEFAVGSGSYQVRSVDAQRKLVDRSLLRASKGLHDLIVPPGGIVEVIR